MSNLECWMELNNQRLKQSQVRKAIKENDYIILRDLHNRTYAVNCKIALLGLKRQGNYIDKLTDFIGFYPCNILQYINNKLPINFYEND